MNAKELENEVVIKMVISRTLEGKELVIEEKKIGKSDEKLGESIVVDKDKLKSSAEIGFIEDVMSTIKTLPGVSFAGGFDSRLSVRGGNPNEFSAVYDGFMVRYPYHWGGVYSIFNPNIVESAKFSNGIFNVKNGLTMSGLLEVESVKPNDGFKFKTVLATNEGEFFLQTPLWSKNSGLLIGASITFTELEMLLSNTIKDSRPKSDDGVRIISPYIRDGYLKWFWKPTNRFEWYINGFFGSDGVGFDYNSKKSANNKSDINTMVKFNWDNYDTFGVTGFKIMPADNVFMHFLAGYEYFSQNTKASIEQNGSMNYTENFIKENPEKTQGQNGYTIKNADSNFHQERILHSIQSRYDTDIKLHEKIMFSVGAGAFYDLYYYGAGGKYYNTEFEHGIPVYKRVSFKVDAADKQYLKTFIYLGFNFKPIIDMLEIEVGCRLDHSIAFSKSFERGTMNSYPVPGPRINITYTPVRKIGAVDHYSISTGAGLYSKAPIEEIRLSKKYGLKDFDILTPQNLNVVLGNEIEFTNLFKIKLEGYYKYYFHRFYINSRSSSNADQTKYFINTDGIGHAAGFDVLIERKLSRYLDGWISYSFIYARYLNPRTNGIESKTSMGGEPTGIYYYPGFHRFHVLNIVLNIRPLPWFTITPKFTFASGAPIKKYGDKVRFPATLDDGTIVQMYTREAEYSDTNRSDVSIPFGLKFAFNFFFPRSKLKFEAYIAVQDLFRLFYSPKGGTKINQYTGEESPAPEANFSSPSRAQRRD